MKPKLSIIGCGTVGRSLGYLWNQSGYFEIADLCSRSIESSQEAKNFIGAGQVRRSLSELQPADVFLMTTSDDQISQAAKDMALATVVQPGNLVLHCSGALPSDALRPLEQQGTLIASAHPIKSFASASNAIQSFEGTYFAIESDQEAAIEQLNPAIAAIQAKSFRIQKEQKVLYHASMTLMCNYLCALLDVGINWLEESGLNQTEAKTAVQPLVQETLNNVFAMNTPDALTGPIARGDAKTLEKQLDAVSNISSEHLDLFRALSIEAVQLASKKQAAPDLEPIKSLLSNS